MKRIYHNYIKWEDFQNGMFALRCDWYEEKKYLANNLLSDESKLLISMRDVVNKWPIASEMNLTNRSRNRQAWLGQAACCFSHGVPEFVTRDAWNELADQIKEKANNIADMVISEWETEYNEL